MRIQWFRAAAARRGDDDHGNGYSRKDCRSAPRDDRTPAEKVRGRGREIGALALTYLLAQSRRQPNRICALS